MYDLNNGLQGFRALHARSRIVGLRSFGKGANRTILDCLVGRLGRRSRSSAAAGVAGAGSPTWSRSWASAFHGHLPWAFPGRFHRLQL